ncbi:D-alanyl-lipoteichoic acid acyltransferase DltB (MBOAT superfamily) [Lutibacter oceani]|uniref:D-alanyl-lipoteichoic acid acyltransferase DltB (MBOAT superfamily) n=1 Tax=Lutibacter oceani TaxID=1853311 RepID=A0A3D9RPY7_9FLAO|nr:MBOAT family O-acyltransferase [Lutibacter oceani]REE81989.1 D-alanyl-lipoteichoic acid acyltransferase DltB (MBOAT superfamily) [Lutibacter oceani]
MLFNSIDFAIFLPIVFLFYWFVFKKNLKQQNIFLIIASYVFYGWWDWRFLFLIVISTLIDYFIGKLLANENNPNKRKFLLWLSIIVNLGFLGFFKYYNFFLENFIEAFSWLGSPISLRSLNIILPVGISFYTFQTLSYSIDVYRKKMKPTNDIIAFAAFVSFFPQLVAGPIERATNLLPQFYKNRVFNYSKAVDGLRQILWGLFKKVVIADNCAYYVNTIFENHEDYSGSTLFLGAVFFAIQIYGDFSGYSDIAIGTGRLFGFKLKQNFAFPYFSRDIAEFWRRWHISLSTWFRDYLYIPLGGSRGAKKQQIRNVFIIFLVSGFWHGANWTFIIWGALNALYFLPLLLSNKNRTHIEIVATNKNWPSINELLRILITFILTTFAWIFFRSESITDAFNYIIGIINWSIFTIPQIRPTDLLILILIFIGIEWIGRQGKYAIENLGFTWKRPIRLLFYYMLIILVFWFSRNDQEFIYFQF